MNTAPDLYLDDKIDPLTWEIIDVHDYTLAAHVLECTPIWLRVFKRIWRYIRKLDNFEDIKHKMLSNSETLMQHIFVLDLNFKWWVLTTNMWREEENAIFFNFQNMWLDYMFKDIIYIIEDEFGRAQSQTYKERVMAILQEEINS